MGARIVGTQPPSVRAAADEAVRELGWSKAYYVDADHINLDTVDGYVDTSDFFTLDVAYAIGKPAEQAAVDALIGGHPELIGKIEIEGIDEAFETTQESVERTAAQFLFAVQEAGRIYRHIESAKGSGNFITEVSMDETDNPQTPAELLVILAAIADESIPIQTIAPKFTGRFNKGVDYVGDTDQFNKEFSDDMAVIRGATRHVACVNESAGGAGDPSRTTAYGVSCGIRAVLKATTGNDSLAGRHIAIQGLGNVGFSVARFCHEAGAKLTVADIYEPVVVRAASEMGAEVVSTNEIYDVECDVFSPNSIGGVINDDTVPRLRCPAVAGGANNVLAEACHADALTARGITYGPDYLVNSGGLIRCQEEVFGRPTEDFTIYSKVTQIYDQTLQVIKLAEELGISTAAAADWMAEERIATKK